MAALLSRLFSRAADVLWPRTCAVEGCPRVSDRPGRHICSSCFASLPFHEAGGACSVCGALVMAETHHSFVCETCRLDPPAFEFARSAVFYREPVDRMIMDFKYRKSTWLCEDLVDLLEGAVRAKLAFHEIDVVMPVPLHQNRLRERGKVPREVKVYIDSPLSQKATRIYAKHREVYNEEARRMLWAGKDPLEYPDMVFVGTPEESMALNDTPGPMIIIAASGMCEGGRVLHHLKHCA